MSDRNEFALVRKPSSAVEKTAPGAKRILASMVADAIVLAAKEDADALYQKGLRIWNWGDKKHQFAWTQAAAFFHRAAEQGHSLAQCTLGLCYYEGEGVPQDFAEAAKWTRKAAEQGNVTAQANLGVAYDRGHGVPQDHVEAVGWHQKAAERGNAGAQNNLGVSYETGQGVPQNKNEAIKWYRKAAEQGNGEAISNLRRLQ